MKLAKTQNSNGSRRFAICESGCGKRFVLNKSNWEYWIDYFCSTKTGVHYIFTCPYCGNRIRLPKEKVPKTIRLRSFLLDKLI